MMSFVSIIKGDYLQRTRSYGFLVTLAISLFVAYTFVPATDANYTTLRVGNYIGEYNSSWIGYVSAIMTSVFLSLFGFYLVNSGIKKDIETEVGMIIATTQVSNFKYLLSKAISNFLVLLTIIAIVLLVNIGIFFLRSTGYAFEITQFVLPYLFVTVPAMFIISCLAVVFEVFLGKWGIVQNVLFFALFNIVMANIQINKNGELLTYVDPFGVKVVTLGIEKEVQMSYNEEAKIKSMGFIFGNKDKLKLFVFDGFSWSPFFILSRIIWMCLGLFLVFVSSVFFHRFDVTEWVKSKKKPKILDSSTAEKQEGNFVLALLPKLSVDYRILPFIKTELLMLVRKGPKWLWIINVGLFVALIFTPLQVAHTFLLPILWFLQVGRLSDLVTKEKTHSVHYFIYAAFQPVKRLLTSQLLAGICLTITLASPLILRNAISELWLPTFGIIIGAVFVTTFAAFLGMLSGGKKLFELLFFALTYINLNQAPFADYFGSTWSTINPLMISIGLISAMLSVSILIRNYEIRTN